MAQVFMNDFYGHPIQTNGVLAPMALLGFIALFIGAFAFGAYRIAGTDATTSEAALPVPVNTEVTTQVIDFEAQLKLRTFYTHDGAKCRVTTVPGWVSPPVCQDGFLEGRNWSEMVVNR